MFGTEDHWKTIAVGPVFGRASFYCFLSFSPLETPTNSGDVFDVFQLAERDPHHVSEVLALGAITRSQYPLGYFSRRQRALALAQDVGYYLVQGSRLPPNFAKDGCIDLAGAEPCLAPSVREGPES